MWAVASVAAVLLFVAGCGPAPSAGVEGPRASSTVTSEQSTRTGPSSRASAAGTPTAAIAQLEQDVTQRINAIRREHQLNALAPDPALARIARNYSCLMAERDFFAHVSPAGENVADRVREAGQRYLMVGENLAVMTNAPQPAQLAVQGWMDSPGHRENVLRAGFTETGVGVCGEGRTYYFTQIFMHPR